MAADFLRFEEVSKHFGKTRAVETVSFEIRRGEFFSLLGPSGCGKTTLLRLVAGFEIPDTGRIFLDGKALTTLPPNRRPVNTIFQNYALFPHLTVRDNIAFGPRSLGWKKNDVTREVDRMLNTIQMEELAGKLPGQLSGGQKQRVAIARALINKPQVLLLDEPLAALDLKLRQKMLVELMSIHKEVGITFVFVTHDQGEAMSVSDRMAVMNQGRIEQIGTPVEIYTSPDSAFVASFIGDTNFFSGVVVDEQQQGQVGLEIPGLPKLRCRCPVGTMRGDRVSISLRPEAIDLASERNGSAPLTLPGTIEDVIYLGSHTRYRVRTGDLLVTVFRQQDRLPGSDGALRRGASVWISWQPDDAIVVK